MQVFPQCFTPFPAVYMHTTGGIRVVDPEVAASNQKQTSNPKFGTKECIKAHHHSFRCPLPVNVGEVKSGDLLKMPHLLAKQNCSEQTSAILQGRWKTTNDWAGGIRHREPGHKWRKHWWGRMKAFIRKTFLTFSNLNLRLLSSFDEAF